MVKLISKFINLPWQTITMASRIFILSLLLLGTITASGQATLGMYYEDAVLKLGPEHTKAVEGTVTKLTYTDQVIDHPGFGVFREYNQYDFLKGVCEARHTFMPKAYKQAFTDHLNKKFGKGDNLWHGENFTYIAIKDRGELFELMVWTPAYEEMLDNR